MEPRLAKRLVSIDARSGNHLADARLDHCFRPFLGLWTGEQGALNAFAKRLLLHQRCQRFADELAQGQWRLCHLSRQLAAPVDQNDYVLKVSASVEVAFSAREECLDLRR